MRKPALFVMSLIFATPAHALGPDTILPVSVTCPGEDKTLTIIFEGRKRERMRLRGTFDHGLKTVEISMAAKDEDFTVLESMTALEADTPSDRMTYMMRAYVVAIEMQACQASDEARRLFQEMLKANKADIEKP